MTRPPFFDTFCRRLSGVTVVAACAFTTTNAVLRRSVPDNSERLAVGALTRDSNSGQGSGPSTQMKKFTAKMVPTTFMFSRGRWGNPVRIAVSVSYEPTTTQTFTRARASKAATLSDSRPVHLSGLTDGRRCPSLNEQRQAFHYPGTEDASIAVRCCPRVVATRGETKHSVPRVTQVSERVGGWVVGGWRRVVRVSCQGWWWPRNVRLCLMGRPRDILTVIQRSVL